MVNARLESIEARGEWQWEWEWKCECKCWRLVYAWSVLKNNSTRGTAAPNVAHRIFR